MEKDAFGLTEQCCVRELCLYTVTDYPGSILQQLAQGKNTKQQWYNVSRHAPN
jgi:hypothetical protein